MAMERRAVSVKIVAFERSCSLFAISFLRRINLSKHSSVVTRSKSSQSVISSRNSIGCRAAAEVEAVEKCRLVVSTARRTGGTVASMVRSSSSTIKSSIISWNVEVSTIGGSRLVNLACFGFPSFRFSTTTPFRPGRTIGLNQQLEFIFHPNNVFGLLPKLESVPIQGGRTLT